MKLYLQHKIVLFQIAFILQSFKPQNHLKSHIDPQMLLPPPIIKFLASKHIRYQHYMWHNCRNRWMSLTQTEQEKLKKMGWEPPRPAIDSNGNYLIFNNSGEDFLYMHRHMIQMVNNLLSKSEFAYGKEIRGWKEIPEPGDKLYPVPPPYGNNTFQQYLKSDSYFYNSMKPLSNKFKNPEYLKTVSLGQLGSEIEFQIHNMMHIRWASNFHGTRPEIEPFYDVEKIEKGWNREEYDWLEDFYSSHVNPIFYKLHGWIDDRIIDWQVANDVKEIYWKGNWTGPHHSDFLHNNTTNIISNSDKIDKKENNSSLLGNNSLNNNPNKIDLNQSEWNHNLHSLANTSSNTIDNNLNNNTKSKENSNINLKDLSKNTSNSNNDSNKSNIIKVFINKTNYSNNTDNTKSTETNNKVDSTHNKGKSYNKPTGKLKQNTDNNTNATQPKDNVTNKMDSIQDGGDRNNNISNQEDSSNSTNKDDSLDKNQTEETSKNTKEGSENNGKSHSEKKSWLSKFLEKLFNWRHFFSFSQK